MIQKYCSICRTPIERGFLCDDCKRENRREAARAAQHRAYLKRKAERARLIQENEELKQKLEEKNAD